MMSNPKSSGVSRLHIGWWAIGSMVVVVAAVLLLNACSGAAGNQSPVPSNTSAPGGNASAGVVSFSKDIQPILESRCNNCHGGRQTSRGLNLTTYQNLMDGSANGAVVVPGDAAHSLLLQMVQQGRMPKSGPQLLPRQIQTLSQWITAGAPDN
jgi:uncharacterized membrane protein